MQDSEKLEKEQLAFSKALLEYKNKKFDVLSGKYATHCAFIELIKQDIEKSKLDQNSTHNIHKKTRQKYEKLKTDYNTLRTQVKRAINNYNISYDDSIAGVMAVISRGREVAEKLNKNPQAKEIYIKIVNIFETIPEGLGF